MVFTVSQSCSNSRSRLSKMAMLPGRLYCVTDQVTSGRERLEDPVAMLRKYPLINEYWRDKRARIDRIEVPAYILASYSTLLHLPGSLRGFEEIPHQSKWYNPAASTLSVKDQLRD